MTLISRAPSHYRPRRTRQRCGRFSVHPMADHGRGRLLYRDGSVQAILLSPLHGTARFAPQSKVNADGGTEPPNRRERTEAMRRSGLAAIAAATLFSSQAAESQPVSLPVALTYADLADLAVTAPVAAHVRIARAERLRAEEAASAPAGHRRFLVEADIVALIRGAQGMPARIRYLVDLPNDARGRAADLRRRSEWLLLASRAPARPEELRLVAPDAQLPYSAELAERLRAILRESSAATAAPRITGIGRAFHVPGSLPGESETQFFLQTANNRPISISVLRRPNEPARWGVSLTEVIDEAAPSPARDTLLWYRLACSLPAQLPRASLGEANAEEAGAIETDYRLVIENLGRCPRNRPRA
jgi:hypothetical protein